MKTQRVKGKQTKHKLGESLWDYRVRGEAWQIGKDSGILMGEKGRDWKYESGTEKKKENGGKMWWLEENRRGCVWRGKLGLWCLTRIECSENRMQQAGGGKEKTEWEIWNTMSGRREQKHGVRVGMRTWYFIWSARLTDFKVHCLVIKGKSNSHNYSSVGDPTTARRPLATCFVPL